MRLAGLPSFRALSAREKLQLLDKLWQDVAHDLDSVEVSGAEKELLDQRWADFLREPGTALSLEQFRVRVTHERVWGIRLRNRLYLSSASNVAMIGRWSEPTPQLGRVST